MGISDQSSFLLVDQPVSLVLLSCFCLSSLNGTLNMVHCCVLPPEPNWSWYCTSTFIYLYQQFVDNSFYLGWFVFTTTYGFEVHIIQGISNS